MNTRLHRREKKWLRKKQQKRQQKNQLRRNPLRKSDKSLRFDSRILSENHAKSKLIFMFTFLAWSPRLA